MAKNHWIVLAAILYGFVYWLALRRRRLIAGREKSIKPPYIWNLQFPDLPAPDPGDTLAPALNAMRRRTEDDVFLLDVPASVRASIRKGGMATFQFRQQTKPPNTSSLSTGTMPEIIAPASMMTSMLIFGNDVLVERFFLATSPFAKMRSIPMVCVSKNCCSNFQPADC